MDNISWGKTIGNWGNNEQNFDPYKSITSKKGYTKILRAEAVEKLDAIYLEYVKLLEMSIDLYKIFPNKDFSDSIISLESALKALKCVTVPEETVVEPEAVEASQN